MANTQAREVSLPRILSSVSQAGDVSGGLLLDAMRSSAASYCCKLGLQTVFPLQGWHQLNANTLSTHGPCCLLATEEDVLPAQPLTWQKPWGFAHPLVVPMALTRHCLESLRKH